MKEEKSLHRDKDGYLLAPESEPLHFRIHVPNFFGDTLANIIPKNAGSVVGIPLQIFQKWLIAIVERSAEINDPVLDKLMVEGTCYEIADQDKPTFDRAAVSAVYERFDAYKNAEDLADKVVSMQEGCDNFEADENEPSVCVNCGDFHAEDNTVFARKVVSK